MTDDEARVVCSVLDVAGDRASMAAQLCRQLNVACQTHKFTVVHNAKALWYVVAEQKETQP